MQVTTMPSIARPDGRPRAVAVVLAGGGLEGDVEPLVRGRSAGGLIDRRDLFLVPMRMPIQRGDCVKNGEQPNDDCRRH